MLAARPSNMILSVMDLPSWSQPGVDAIRCDAIGPPREGPPGTIASMVLNSAPRGADRDPRSASEDD